MKKGYDYLYEKIDLLPADVAEVVLNFNYVEGFKSLSNKYKLHIDQAAALEDATFRLMMGDSESKDFIQQLVSEARLAEGVAKELAVDTQAALIEPIKQAIQKHIADLESEVSDIDDSEVEEEGNEIPETPAPAKISGSELNAADILHGIENPHPTVGNIIAPKKVPSFSDIMGTGNKPSEIVTPKPSPAAPTMNTNPVAPAVEPHTSSVSFSDLMNNPGKKPAPIGPQQPKPAAPSTSSINQKATAITVSAPTKSSDPYKEPIA